MAKTSYLRALAGMSPGAVPTLRPLHRPAWGLSAYFGRPRFTSSAPRDSERTSSHFSLAQGVSVQGAEQEHTPSRGEQDDLRMQPVGPAKAEPDAIASSNIQRRKSTPGQEHDSARTGSFSSTNVPPSLGSADQPNRLQTAEPLPQGISPSSKRTTSTTVMPDRSSASVFARERLEHLSAETGAMQRAVPASPLEIKRCGPDADGSRTKPPRAEMKNTKLHIGAIDIQIVQAPPEVRTTQPRLDSPSPGALLSRGFASTYGLRQS